MGPFNKFAQLRTSIQATGKYLCVR